MKKNKKPNDCPDWIIITKPLFNKVSQQWEINHKDSVSGEMKTYSYTHRQTAQNKYDKIVTIEKERKKEELSSKEKNQNIEKTKAQKEKNKYGVEAYNYEAINQRHKDILEDIIEGMPTKDIEAKYSLIYNLSTNTISMDIMKVNKQIKDYSMHKHQDVVLIHLDRYELFYRKFRELNSDSLAMKCLKLKENLHGIHNEVVTMQVNNYQETQDHQNKYNISKLSELQKKRLVTILDKAYRLNIEVKPYVNYGKKKALSIDNEQVKKQP